LFDLRFSRRWLWRIPSSGIENPGRTSQETYYVSATGSERLMLCKIWGLHCGVYEGCRPLGCCAVWLLYESTFGRNLAPPPSGRQESVN
jgi:hypothetical protein